MADQDITIDDLAAICTQLLTRTGWAQSLGPDDTAELAGEMAAEGRDPSRTSDQRL